jgi:hypothetical protein
MKVLKEKQMSGLKSFIGLELARPQPKPIVHAANEIMKRFKDHPVGVVFYGSCLRTGQVEDRILDFYIIVDDYHKAYGGLMLAWANKILPPNVFYAESTYKGVTLRSKYAVVSLADFEYRVTEDCLNISIWARFSQPSALISVKDEHVTERLNVAISNAVKTMIGAILPFMDNGASAETIWTGAFDKTYGAELRAEKPGKGKELYDLDKARYDGLMDHVLEALGAERVPEEQGWAFDRSRARLSAVKGRWFWRRWNGKTVSLLRLFKASTTFDGGIDYIAWKISRHSGIPIDLKPWHRRFPIIAGLWLFIHYRKKGAFR